MRLFRETRRKRESSEAQIAWMRTANLTARQHFDLSKAGRVVVHVDNLKVIKVEV